MESGLYTLLLASALAYGSPPPKSIDDYKASQKETLSACGGDNQSTSSVKGYSAVMDCLNSHVAVVDARFKVLASEAAKTQVAALNDIHSAFKAVVASLPPDPQFERSNAIRLAKFIQQLAEAWARYDRLSVT